MRGDPQLALVFRTHGGPRKGAGRKCASLRPNVPHRARPRTNPRHPLHVTLRAAAVGRSLRDGGVFPAIRAALAHASHDTFRVLHYSVQRDHVHVLVEADAPIALMRGMQGLATRVAKAVNRALGRHGQVWAERYHARALATPREVRNALLYVLGNWRKHIGGGDGVDPCSSASTFDGWSRRLAAPIAALVAPPRTWLARVGWRRYGPLDPKESPAVRRRRSRR